LAVVEVMHWYEAVLFLGYVGMFFVWAGPWTLAVGVVCALVAYFVEIVIDNTFARVKWQLMLALTWAVTLICTVLSLLLLFALQWIGWGG
jgi:predicted membrane protein